MSCKLTVFFDSWWTGVELQNCLHSVLAHCSYCITTPKKNHQINDNELIMSATSVNDPSDDPVDSMLKKTGCISLHYKVQVISIFQNTFLIAVSTRPHTNCRSVLLRLRIGVNARTSWKNLRPACNRTLINNNRNIRTQKQTKATTTTRWWN